MGDAEATEPRIPDALAERMFNQHEALGHAAAAHEAAREALKACKLHLDGVQKELNEMVANARKGQRELFDGTPE